MPQELHVLRCVECGTFQVHIVKKIPKWACKICQKKQSVLQVFGSGSGKECRLHVQRLNELRMHQGIVSTSEVHYGRSLQNSALQEEPIEASEKGASKWNKYLDEKVLQDESEEDCDVGLNMYGWEIEKGRKRKCVSGQPTNRNDKKPAPYQAEVEPELSREEMDIGASFHGRNSKKIPTNPKVEVNETAVVSKWAKYVGKPIPDGSDSSSNHFQTDGESGANAELDGEELDELLKF